MIITRLKAENILKYSLLEIAEVPDKGLIGVRGPNEAGKSTVAEAICLGLYGRTFGFDQDLCTKAIKWGAASGSVEIEFRVADNEVFLVSRFFDLEGTHGARLTKKGSKKPLAQGEAVSAEIGRITGCDFQQYVDAFYLAQREFSIPHAQSDMLKGLLGVSEFDRVGDSLQTDIRNDSETIDELKARIGKAGERIEELAIDASALERLEQKRLDALAKHDAARQTLNERRATIATIGENLAALKQSIRSCTDIDANAAYPAWVEFSNSLSGPFIALQGALAQDDPSHAEISEVEQWVTDLEQRVDAAQALVTDSQLHAEQLQNWLTVSNDEGESKGAREPAYPDEMAAIDRRRGPIEGTRRRKGLLSVLSLLLSALTGASWYALTRLQGTEINTMVGDWYTRLYPQFSEQHHALLLYAAGAFGFLFLWFMIAAARAASRLTELDDERFRLERRAERAREDIARIHELENGSLSDTFERISALEDERLAKEAEAYLAGPGLELISSEGWAELSGRCEHLYSALESAQAEITPRLEQEESDLAEALGSADLDVQSADNAISEERARLDEQAQLSASIEADKQALEAPRDRIEVRKTGLELLQGATRRIYTHFNLQLRDYLSSLLPLFTEGRYQHLKIDDNFDVQVFSLEKNDFVGLDDLSSGTQRQLVLAIRLAMSQALVDSRRSGQQTLILDEPFAFFDRERMRQTLATFGAFSQEIQQIWVISQEFDDDCEFALLIDCDRDADSLSL